MLRIAKMIARKAQTQNNWQVYAVGGFVRDMMLGVKSKDLDLEVFGPNSVDELIVFLQQFGKVDAVGKSFGVLKLRVNGVDLDVSLPRTESKQGQGHKGFVIKADGKLTPQQAALRRDFTFNALMLRLPECEIVDFFDGQKDLHNKCLVHTSKYFADDPLRVLRGMQFCGRFDLIANKETIKMCRSLLPEFETLAKERLWIEFEKWAVKSIKSSRGLTFLYRSGWLKKFPELYALVGCKQSSEYHAEGSVWIHTKMVCDEAIKIAGREKLNKEERLILVLAALLHDVGKPQTTDTETLSAHSHAREGVRFAESFLHSINAPLKVIEQVCSLVGEHMSYVTTPKGVRRVSSRIKTPLRLLMLLMEADTKGRIALDEKRQERGFAKIAKMGIIAEKLNVVEDKIQPILMGRHLIELGMSPGKEFGVILADAMECQINGEFESLEGAKQWLVWYTSSTRGV